MRKKQKNTLEKLELGQPIDELYARIANQLHEARKRVVRSINTEMVQTYWEIGREIIEEELKGKKRAGYGEELVKSLSNRLTHEFGKGFTITNLKYMRLFFLKYRSLEIGHAVRDQSSQRPIFSKNLSWTHYRVLTKVLILEARLFYEQEAIQNNWSARELERQVNSLLFERLSKSRDKKGLLRLAQKGQEIQTPEDAMKDPVVLEFLDIPESHRLTESKLEEALIDNMQNFLLELGKGFAFIARQRRLTLDGDHFYADLVFYHAILQCYVVIDIKTKKLSHADLGQIQLYVNYFDKEVRTANDNPTIGLILCTSKNDAMVKYTLADKAKQIFASTYQFHLPTEEELEVELKRELREIKYQLEDINGAEPHEK
ncbi:MAG: PDDEXK nuclease domain-containing protein [Myxococcaceae bacterium]